MSFYHSLGRIPPKRHITFYKKDKKSLYREEHVSSLGFSGVYSNRYHIHMPTQVLKIKELLSEETPLWEDVPLQNHHFFTERKKSKGNFITARTPYLKNSHCVISTAHVTQNTEDFFKNSYAHEVIFIHHGKGVFLSEYGSLAFEEGDKLVIPKSTLYQLKFKEFKNNKILVVESDTAFDIPKHYRNDYGQLLESAPYCERDLRAPQFLKPQDKHGKFRLILKAGERLFEHLLNHHPFDVVGWDGYLYPYILNIKSFAPKVGQVHLPPPVHQVFKTGHFVYCTFVPRLFDFHPKAIPAPYFHSNIDSDEVIYYAEGNFMSRKGIEEGSITLHPAGVAHGPQPGKTEESIGKKETYEYAIMIDTFSPLSLTLNAKETVDPQYPYSWLKT